MTSRKDWQTKVGYHTTIHVSSVNVADTNRWIDIHVEGDTTLILIEPEDVVKLRDVLNEALEFAEAKESPKFEEGQLLRVVEGGDVDHCYRTGEVVAVVDGGVYGYPDGQYDTYLVRRAGDSFDQYLQPCQLEPVTDLGPVTHNLYS